jgi:CRISPR-associated protein Csx17
MIHVHDLNGCAPTPLAHYLKALGILRLVAEQADPQARGWWEGERFRLATILDQPAVETFFLERYEPTPVFNPWGGRSGFYPDSSERKARTVLMAIENTADSRFKSYQEVLKVVRQTITESTGGTKPSDEDKDRLVLALRRFVRGKSPLWMDAVTAVIGSGDNLEVEQPALFGTGGNEGSGSYTSAYMAAIDQCLLKHAWDHAISKVLSGNNDSPRCDWNQSMGQFIPEGAATPWDLLLAFEGACIVRSAVSTRNTTASARWMSSPFYVAPTSYGYPSEARMDEYALKNGKELPGRGEQWFPLWSQPTSFEEVSQIFVEGRAATRRGRAMDGWSMVRAITSLGTRQGIREFVRYGYQQRNNLATHFAVPLGRFRVPERNSPESACLDDLDSGRFPWLPNLRRAARNKSAPGRLAQAERRLADALFALAQHPSEFPRWQAVLLALAEVEGIQANGSGFEVGPTPRLRPEWVEAADDSSAEFRLALSFALQASAFNRETGMPIDSIRRHWLPLDKEKPWKFATTGTGGQTRLSLGPDVVIRGRNGIDDAIALVERRLIEAGQRGERRLPLQAAVRAVAHPADLSALIAGAVDMNRTLSMGRALMALDRELWPQQIIESSRPGQDNWPDDAWLVIRLALLPWPLKTSQGGDIRIGTDPAIFRRLSSGDAPSAVDLCLRRLRAAGIQTTVRVASVSAETARLWAAALAFPISQRTASIFLRHLDPNALSTGERS